ncbi:hypothetical protein JCM17843_04990 [Kordiimonadales bacterium JCM 17843]|nr:hypothetical protein JCM17843_04990 [Kordiimonadales bacterium JCM 17843]
MGGANHAIQPGLFRQPRQPCHHFMGAAFDAQHVQIPRIKLVSTVTATSHGILTPSLLAVSAALSAAARIIASPPPA